MRNKRFILILVLLFVFNFCTINVQAMQDNYDSRAIGNVNIISTTDVSLESVEAWARSKNATDSFVSLAKLYKKYASERGGVNWVLAYVQAAKETGYGKFGGVLNESYYNPCGLKNPQGGGDYDPDAHKKFDNWEQGVIAHLDHLALYAAATGYPKTVYVDKWKNDVLASNETYDPRHIGWYSTAGGILGKAKDVISLGGKWAPSETYGAELFRMYCEATNSEYLEARSSLELPSQGSVIDDGKLNIKGWALHAFGIREVKVLIDGNQIATLNTDISREDVNKAYPGYYNGSNSGFSGIVDISNIAEGNRTLQVVIVANDGTTQSHTRNIVVNGSKLPTKSNLDEPKGNTIATGDTLNIRGWALDSSGIKEVRVYVDEKDLGTVKYGTVRADVNKAHPGYPSGDNAGFEGSVDISSISAGSKKLTVRITANDGTTQSIETTIKVERLQSRSNLDSPKGNDTVNNSTLNVKGWALASSGVKEVRVYVDGKDLGTVKYGTTRADVNKAYPGYPSGDNAGFEGSVDISTISTGSKSLTIKITANDGTTQSIQTTIKIEKLQSKSNLDSPKGNSTFNSNTLNVKGWALASSGVKEVRVYVDGKDLGTVKYGTARADVNKAHPGYPSGDNAGFEGSVDISSISAGSKKLTVKITANDGTTQSIETTIKIEKLQSKSNLDSPKGNTTFSSNTLNVRGWALASSGVKEVRVYVDGKDLGTVKYGTARADVNKAHPGYPSGDNAGFEGSVDISSISAGSKKLTVKITANDGTTQSIETTIKIEKLQSKSNLDSPKGNTTFSSNTLNVRGWALASSGVKEVRVYVDGKDLGTVKYGTARADVNKAHPGYPSGDNAGFEGSVDISSISAGSKKLTVKITANDGTTQSIETTINIEKLQSRSNLDEIKTNVVGDGNTSLSIRGWALAGSGIKEVRVYVDGKDLGTVKYGTLRADVNKAYPGYPSGDNAGFEGSIDISSLSGGDKKLSVKITANDGTVQTIERSFVYKKSKLIVIDPGHENPGGDPGAVATHNGIQYIESNLNLQIAVRLKAELEKRGFDIVMTRSEGSGQIGSDISDSLRKRVKLANDLNADFFISLHHNSGPASAQGFEVWYSIQSPTTRSVIFEDTRSLSIGRDIAVSDLDYKISKSRELAEAFTKTVSSTLGLVNRGAKYEPIGVADYYVTKNTNMPSVIVENGFLTNESEAKKVSERTYQQKLAEILADIIYNKL